MKTIIYCLCFSILFSWSSSQASEESEGLSYESIVSKYDSESRVKAESTRDALDDVKIHFGAGFKQTFFSMKHRYGQMSQISQNGFGLVLGIDLFSANWLAEGSFLNYGSQHYELADITMKEFNLRVIYHDKFAPHLGYRFGGGLGARYINEKYSGPQGGYEQDHAIPSALFSLGPDFFFNEKVSVGVEIAARAPLVDETEQQTEFDAGIRFEGHF